MGLLIVLRIVVHQSFEQTLFAHYPIVDGYTYWAQAKSLLSGDNPFVDGFYQAPGYPFFLYVLGKAVGGLSLSLVRQVQLCMGIISCLLIIRIAKQCFPSKPMVGPVAAFMYGTMPHLLFFELDILTPALSNLLLLTAITLALDKGFWKALSAGWAAGLMSVVHPTLLLIAAFLPFLHRMRGGTVLPLAIGLLLGLAPTVVLNTQQGMPAVVSHNAGINFFLGNNSNWKQTSMMRPGLAFRDLALEAEPHIRDLAARNRYWLQRTGQEIAAHPERWGLRLAKKFIWSIHHREIPRNEDYRCRMDDTKLSWIAYIPMRWWVIFLLAMLSVGSFWRERSVRVVLGLWILCHLPMLLFLAADRYRMSTLPMVSLLAAYVVCSWRAISWRRALPWAGIVVGLMAWLPIDAITKKQEDQCLHVKGNLAFMDKQYAKAKMYYEKSIRHNPNNYDAQRYLSQIAEHQKDLPQAIDWLIPVAKQYPEHFPTLRKLAKLYLRIQDRESAISYLQQAYQTPGNRTSTGLRLVALLFQSGQIEKAQQILRSDPQVQRRWAAKKKSKSTAP